MSKGKIRTGNVMQCCVSRGAVKTTLHASHSEDVRHTVRSYLFLALLLQITDSKPS